MLAALLLSTALSGSGGAMLSVPPPAEQVLPGVCSVDFRKSVATHGVPTSAQVREYLIARLSCDRIGSGRRAEQFLSAILRDGRMSREQIDLLQDFLSRQIGELYGTPDRAKAEAGGEVVAVINAAAYLLERLQLSDDPDYRLAGLQASFAWSGQLEAASVMRGVLDKDRRAAAQKAAYK